MTDKKAVLKQLGWSDALIDAFFSEAPQQDWAVSLFEPDLPPPVVSRSDLTIDFAEPPTSSGQTLVVKIP